MRIVTTSNILDDWVYRIGGDRVEVFSLLPVGSDPHTYQPGTRDVALLADADLVLTFGLGLEAAWMDELVRNANADSSRVVALGEVVDPLPAPAEMDRHGSGRSKQAEATYGPGEELWDPHFWFDPLRVKRAAAAIAAQLAALDPAAGGAYRHNAEAYGRELDDLHEWIQEQVGAILPGRRLLVTSHGSLQYFARLYGFEVPGTVFQGLTTERDPPAEELAELVETIREHEAAAIFTETTVGDRLAQAIATETGARVVSALHTGSLGEPGSGAATYLDMMRHNVAAIVHALR